MKYNTITKAVAETVPGGIYEGIDYHGTPPADVAARAGWVDVTPEIQAQLDADKAVKDAADAKATAEAEAQARADEDKRILALPSIAAIVTENAALRDKLTAAEAELAKVKATADKAAADVAKLEAVMPK
jgi:hypothetical protein